MQRTTILLSLLAFVAIVACNYLIDAQAALLIQKVLFANRYWVRATSDLPDLLLLAVIAIALAGGVAYLIRKKLGVYDAATDLALMMSLSVPVSFLCKTILKVIFGRVNTRHWLLDPSLYGFHWFQGGGFFNGFPSGHMAVFTTFAAVVWRIYPRYGRWYATALLLTGLALVATNYHFISDVIAGTVVGIIVEATVWKWLHRRGLLHVS